jgi:hypothetical protein
MYCLPRQQVSCPRVGRTVAHTDAEITSADGTVLVRAAHVK